MKCANLRISLSNTQQNVDKRQNREGIVTSDKTKHKTATKVSLRKV